MKENKLYVHDYIVAGSTKINEFTAQVKEALNSGYKLSGGMTCDHENCFYQALVKYDYNKPPEELTHD